jgi:tRNA pseudouridine38-40 synthase
VNPGPASPLRTLRLVLEYDGTGFAGWQVQRGKRTVQAEVAKAVQRVTGERVTVYGASRTDAGVHAEGQAAHIRTRTRIACARLVHALNANLPPDVTVLRVDEPPEGFHAQFDAAGKTYRYRVLRRDVRSALRRDRAYLVRSPLDVGRMREAAARLVGTHDFRAFCTEARTRKRTERRIDRLEIRADGDEVVFEVDGSGFLYNMVRTIVGTLLWVGIGRLGPDDVSAILDSRDRRRAGSVVPPQGLTLVEVRYGGPDARLRGAPVAARPAGDPG